VDGRKRGYTGKPHFALPLSLALLGEG